jgi:hypothetical protein
LVSDDFNHLLAIHDQIVLVHCFNEHRAQILNDRRAVWTLDSVLILNLLDDGLHDVQFDG